MSTKNKRQGLKIMKLAETASSALQGYQKTKSSEDEKTRTLKERLRKERQARRRK